MSFAFLGGGTNDFSVVAIVTFFASSKDIFVAHPEKITKTRISGHARRIAYFFFMAFPSQKITGLRSDRNNAL